MDVQEMMSPRAWRVWIGVGVALLLATLLLFGLVAYASFEGLGIVRDHGQAGSSFLLLGLALAQAGLLRSLAMLIGLALSCGGLLVSFLALREAVVVDAQSAGAGGGLKIQSTSPGVVAIVLGALVVIAALFSTTSLQLPPGDAQRALAGPGQTGVGTSTPNRPAGPIPLASEVLRDAKDQQNPTQGDPP
jgi:hypothetical protein